MPQEFTLEESIDYALNTAIQEVLEPDDQERAINAIATLFRARIMEAPSSSAEFVSRMTPNMPVVKVEDLKNLLK